jgi:sugar lactone lactonase YvrE
MGKIGVIPALEDFFDRFLGRGDAAITVPTFDGALKPNQLLERAEVVGEFAEPEDISSMGGALYLADGPVLRRLEAGSWQEVRRFDKPITALCGLPDGRLAVALAGTEIRVLGAAGANHAAAKVVSGAAMQAVNALAAGPDGTLFATDGSASEPHQEWARDLLNRGRSGRLLVINPETSEIKVRASGLHYAFGVATVGQDALVSESWRHRLVAVGPNGAVRSVLDQLPVYPSRIVAASDGGFWLTAFTARTQLIEFVLRESGYRKRMMREVPPEFWVVPRLRAGGSFQEPMQGAHLKTMGVVKPWAPPRSYGLVIRLAADFSPMFSFHSRVDGHNHGVVAAAELNGALYVLAKGPRRLLRLGLSEAKKALAA